MIRLLISIIGIIFIISCETNEGYKPIPFTKYSFPLNIGNWWYYQVIGPDTLGNLKTDSIKLSVISLIELNGLKQYRCNIEKNFFVIDSALISLSDTLISYKGLNPNGDSFFCDFTFKLPFTLGDTWSKYPNSNPGDYNVISFQNNYLILGKSYNIFTIKRKAHVIEYAIDQTLQVSENIGIVNQYINYTIGHNNQTFNLIDFELK